MSTIRETIYKELLIRYRKDKIRNYLYEKEKNLTLEKKQELEKKVEELWKNNLKNSELLKEICGFVLVEYSDGYDISMLNKLMYDAKRFRKKSFHISNIDRIYSEMITNYSFGVSLVKTNKYDVKVSDTTGLFKINFSDGTFMYYAKWISGGGKARSVEGMFAAEKSVWLNFLRMIKQERKKNAKPKNGIYRIFNDGMGGIAYKKLEDLQETPIVHPSTEILLRDITYYFGHVPLFTRFGMPGVRKSLIVGPPGTGKTSMAIKLSKKFEQEKCIVFSTSIGDVAQHLAKCAAHNVSTIVILEDAESTLANANSSLLNFLDGVDLPKNINGSYIIMTTNHPDRIEPRILQRPGRVDKIIEFGNLTGSYVIKCAEIYFDEILFNDKNRSSTKIGKKIREELYPCINKMSGAEIKELSQASASYAVSEEREVTVELIKEVKKKMKEDIQSISKYASEQSSLAKRKAVGFEKDEEDSTFFSEKYLETVETY